MCAPSAAPEPAGIHARRAAAAVDWAAVDCAAAAEAADTASAPASGEEEPPQLSQSPPKRPHAEEAPAAATASPSGKAEKRSRYVGVSWRKDRRRWEARISHEGRLQGLGYFAEEEEESAARAFDAAARRLRGNSAHGGGNEGRWRLNFPTEAAAEGAPAADGEPSKRRRLQPPQPQPAAANDDVSTSARADETALEQSVRMWNTETQKRLQIHCDDTKRCDVQDFMRRHPEYVPYTGQDRALEEQRKRLEVVGRMDGTNSSFLPTR